MKGGRIRFRNLPVWMRIGVSAWSEPRDPSIHFTLEADMTRTQAWMSDLSSTTGTKVTPTALVVKALATVIAEVGDLNRFVQGHAIYRRDSIDATIMLGGVENNELGVVTLRRVDAMGVAELAAAISSTRDDVKTRGQRDVEAVNKVLSLVPQWLFGPLLQGAIGAINRVQYRFGLDTGALGLNTRFGSFFVSNVGSLGLDAGFAPFHPLANIPIGVVVGRVAERPAVVDGKVEARPMLRLAFTCDHRIVSPRHMALGARRIKEILEDPARHLA